MQVGHERFPHEYVQKIRTHDGKFRYVYGKQGASFAQATAGSNAHLVVMSHGKPTQIMVRPDGAITSGPPIIVGRSLFLNNNKGKPYFGIAKDPAAPPIYLYPPEYLKQIASKKAAKFVKASRALHLVDAHAEKLMQSSSALDRDYGLAMWLNNNTQMRIGAHEDAASVDPKERAKIINAAKNEGWNENTKRAMLDKARKQTYGLLSMRMGHITFEGGGGTKVTFRFLGKGGKENTYTANLPPRVWQLMFQKKYAEGKQPDSKLFPEAVNYKKIWRTYKQYGTTPHVSRGAYAESLVSELMRKFQVRDDESAKVAVNRFNDQVQSAISDRLNHSRSMTERSYFSESTRQAVNDFRSAIKDKHHSLHESDISPVSDALGEAVLWLELGAGNTVI